MSRMAAAQRSPGSTPMVSDDGTGPRPSPSSSSAVGLDLARFRVFAALGSFHSVFPMISIGSAELISLISDPPVGAFARFFGFAVFMSRRSPARPQEDRARASDTRA